MSKFVKVMFGTASGAKRDFEYKINEVNVSENWNPNAENGRDFGGFNYCSEECILRWLHRGDTLYVTNTTAEINLENNTIINNDTNGNFLRIQKDSWGNTGSNGGTVTLNMTNQKASGNIAVDSISTLTINMTNNSYYEGMINNENTAKSITLKLDKTSKIKLTGDTYITSLDNADTTNSNIDFNGYKLYVNNSAIN